MSHSEKCPKCGAPAEGLLCRFCGSLLQEAGSPEEESRALDEFHAELGKADGEGRKRLLSTGFIPDTTPGLIEAGVMCLPLCRDDTMAVADAALHRLEAVMAKLEMARETAEIRKALEQFRKVAEERKRKARSDTWMGCTMFIVLAALIVALTVYILHRILR